MFKKKLYKTYVLTSDNQEFGRILGAFEVFAGHPKTFTWIWSDDSDSVRVIFLVCTELRYRMLTYFLKHGDYSHSTIDYVGKLELA